MTECCGEHLPPLGSSALMLKLFEKVEKIASMDSTVLLEGETGTGKSTIARLIHHMSSRASAPLVSINCSAIPRDLLEAELFGHEKGAFTGAVQQRIGCFERAHGGTLFLDEIGELPLDLQPKLLTFLQDQVITRVGGTIPKQLNVRIIAATNRNLEEMSGMNEFRQDLFYRIHVLSLTLPPLRARSEDIQDLAAHILKRLALRRQAKPKQLSQRALEMLTQYDWPGNIRQLENVLERAALFSKDRFITEQDIALPAEASSSTHQSETHIDIGGLTLEEIEQKVFEYMLDHCEGNKVKIAQLLGISTKSVYNKIKKYQLHA